ncbi:MAG: amidohydrolase family protein [Candidatus Sumerlaeia bacterium]|nr:amidohydrolase family protein [Candidatus Sumerlaeia bacterium]
MYFNAHCHLELSALGGRIPRGLSFPHWLESLVRTKRETTQDEIQEGIKRAINRMVDTGTSALADINSADIASGPLRTAVGDGILQVHLYHEILKFEEDKANEAVSEAMAKQHRDSQGVDMVEGLSPHSPYTTTGTLLRSAAKVATERHQWLCIHAAEIPEEREMLLHGRGALRDFLSPFLDPNWKPPGMGPIQWLDACGCLGPRTLLVHCNDINEEDVNLIRDRGASVVVCPGSHIWFGRDAFPLARLIAEGIPVYLGTDSLASNDDLDMGREIQLACELSPGVEEDTIRHLADFTRFRDFVPAP